MKEIQNGIVVHCKTPKEANELLKYLDTRNYRWNDSMPLSTKNYWGLICEDTGYLLWNDKVLLNNYWLSKLEHSNCKHMEFAEFKNEYMQLEIVKPINGLQNKVNKKEDPLQNALQVLSKLLSKEQERCDKWDTEEMIGMSNAYDKCMEFLDELTKNPAEFAQKYQYVSGMTKLEPGDIVEIGENKTRVLVTEMYKDRVPKCCIGVGLNLDSTFASVSINDDVSLKKIGHANLQAVLDNMMRENTSPDKEEFERE